MKVIIWNIKRAQAAWKWLKEEKASVWLLQETSPQPSKFKDHQAIWGHVEEASTAAIISPHFPLKRLALQKLIHEPDLLRLYERLESTPKFRGRLVAAETKIKDKKWIFISYHAFPIELAESQLRFLLKLPESSDEVDSDEVGEMAVQKLNRTYPWKGNKNIFYTDFVAALLMDLLNNSEEMQKSSLVFGGDLNTSLGFDIQFKRKNEDNKRALEIFNTAGFVNCLKKHHSTEYQSYIHTQPNKKKILFQNDHAFINKKLNCLFAYVLGRPLKEDNTAISDHNPILLFLKVK